MTRVSVRLREEVRSSLLVVPGGLVLLAVGLTLLTVRLDGEGLTEPLDAVLPLGSASSTVELLTTIASAAITLTALVFSITMLVLQLSSNQFSPRVLRTFLRDRTAQVTLGVLVGTFVFSLLALRVLDVEESDASSLTAATAMLLALASVAVFVTYINHIAQKIRATSVMRSITDETMAAIERIDGSLVDLGVETLPDRPDTVITSKRRGFVISTATDHLMRAAEHNDVLLVVQPRIGQFITTGSALVDVHGQRLDAVDTDEIAKLVEIGNERTMKQDPLFGFRQLVDIIEKAMSPAVNDTTTAVQAIDHLRELLRAVSQRPLPGSQRRDAQGALRLIMPPASWDDYVSLAVDEVLEVAGESRRIRVAMEELLVETASVALPARKATLAERLVGLRAGDLGPLSLHAHEAPRDGAGPPVQPSSTSSRR